MHLPARPAFHLTSWLRLVQRCILLTGRLTRGAQAATMRIVQPHQSTFRSLKINHMALVFSSLHLSADSSLAGILTLKPPVLLSLRFALRSWDNVMSGRLEPTNLNHFSTSCRVSKSSALWLQSCPPFTAVLNSSSYTKSAARKSAKSESDLNVMRKSKICKTRKISCCRTCCTIRWNKVGLP